LEADVTPFKGLLLGLFFIAVGMYVDLDLLTENPLLIISMTVALMTIKALVLWPLGLWQGLSRRETLKTSLVLAQGGEFAFVLLAAGLGAGLVESQIANTAVLVVTLSMAFTPLLVFLGDRILGDSSAAREFDVINPSDDNAVVIAGFGTVGQIVGRILSTQHIRFTALDVNPQHVDFIRKLGNDTYYGDATRLDVLRAAGVGKARMLVVAIDQEEASEQIVRKVKGVYPAVNVLARAHTRQHELKLKEAGANFVIRDTLLSSLAMATELLLGLGISRADAEQAIERFRDHDAHTLEQQAAVFRDDDAFRQSALSAAEELQQLFDADAAADTERDQSTHDAREPPPAG
jgi:glutathione-regulated potassium-efflux system ancillary protein KefC/glutathione-regulated potassium-efflux system protein KefB